MKNQKRMLLGALRLKGIPERHDTTVPKENRYISGITLIALVITILFSYDEK